MITLEVTPAEWQALGTAIELALAGGIIAIAILVVALKWDDWTRKDK